MEKQILYSLAVFIIGLIILYLGGEGLVRGSSRLARAMGINPVLIGLTIVAFGTSAPELVVSIIAAFKDPMISVRIFFMAAAMFGGVSLLGYTTKKNLF